MTMQTMAPEASEPVREKPYFFSVEFSLPWVTLGVVAVVVAALFAYVNFIKHTTGGVGIHIVSIPARPHVSKEVLKASFCNDVTQAAGTPSTLIMGTIVSEAPTKALRAEAAQVYHDLAVFGQPVASDVATLVTSAAQFCGGA